MEERIKIIGSSGEEYVSVRDPIDSGGKGDKLLGTKHDVALADNNGDEKKNE